MYKLYWIFGGTAVGKKTYVEYLLSKAKQEIPLKATWIEDGEKPIVEILAEAEEANLLIRWQWGREHVLGEIQESHPKVEQFICLLRATPDIQVRRSKKREPEIPRTSEGLKVEAQTIKRLCLWVSNYYNIPYATIAAVRDDVSTWGFPYVL